MNAVIRQTKDGSLTIYLPHIDEHYHSIHGAYTESMHVFIQNGLLKKLAEDKYEINILEIGLGTGLNVLLTIENGKKRKITYTGLEPYPLEENILQQVYFEKGYSAKVFSEIHHSNFNETIGLAENFDFLKSKQRLEDFKPVVKYDLIYFDAFGPRVQPEIWSLENFQKLYLATSPGGILVTYCSKGDVRRTMILAGFIVEKLPGPPGKREMLRAVKQ